MVDLNRSTRTPLDSERPKLSAGPCREALYITLRSEIARGWPPPQLRSRLVEKEVRARVNFDVYSMTSRWRHRNFDALAEPNIALVLS